MAAPLLIPAAIAIAAEYFPSLATKIGGKRGVEVATKVIATASKIAGVSKDASAQEIVARINANSGGREQVTFELEQLNLQETEIQMEDRQSARAHQLRAGAERGNYMLIGVSVAMTLCVLVIIVPNLTGGNELTAGQIGFLGTIAGALLKMLSDAFAFEFGSSRGSREKDEQQAEMRQSLLQLGAERQAADQEVIRAQEKRLGQAEAVLQAVVPATVITTATQQVVQAAEQTRDFVAQLVSGKLEA